MPDPVPIFRFAPSPNGEMHLGHAFSALLNLKLARKVGGKCLLRIENIDTVRCTPALEKQMLEDLEWVGFEWDEPPRRQSEHFPEYQEILQDLQKLKLVYPATMSRKEIKQQVEAKIANGMDWPFDPDGSPHYPGHERGMTHDKQEALIRSGKQYNLRLDLARALELHPAPLGWDETSSGQSQHVIDNVAAWGDVVLARKDTPASYHMCCVVDDEQQGVTDVVRGQDLYHATAIHRLIQTVLGYAAPTYHHHTLVHDQEGQKLSKSKKPMSLKSMREAGKTHEQIHEMLLPYLNKAIASG